MKKFLGSSYATKKSTWHRPGAVPFYADDNLTPKQYLACLYWFAAYAPYTTARKQAGVSVAKASCTRSQHSLAVNCSVKSGAMGGEGKIVCIDETWPTKKKRSKGGFQGRPTADTKSIVLGMMEINFGCFLLEMPDRSARTLKRLLHQYSCCS